MSRTWTLTIDAPTHHTRDGKTRVLWINANSREHYMARARKTKLWRTAAFEAARRSPIPPLDKARITVTIHKTRGGRYDPGNLAPTAKAAVDGIVDANILPDDDAEHLEGPDMRAGTKADHPHITITIQEVN